MIIRKSVTGACAIALTLALIPWSELQAAPLVAPGAQPSVAPLAIAVAEKKEKKHKAMRHHRKRHHKGKRAHSKGPGRCGANMYHSKKHGRCMDARDKK
jgi:hypothetical protein